MENKSIEITIKNQPFTPHSSDGSDTRLYYQVRHKGHFEEDNWMLVYGSPDTYPIQSSSEFTVVSLPPIFPFSAQVDFQLQALRGVTKFINGRIIGAHDYYAFEGETSDWSNTQTIAIPDSSQSTPSPSLSSPDQTTEPELSQTTETARYTASQTLLLGIITGIVLTIVLVSVGLLVYFKRRRHQTIPSSPLFLTTVDWHGKFQRSLLSLVNFVGGFFWGGCAVSFWMSGR